MYIAILVVLIIITIAVVVGAFMYVRSLDEPEPEIKQRSLAPTGGGSGGGTSQPKPDPSKEIAEHNAQFSTRYIGASGLLGQLVEIKNSTITDGRISAVMTMPGVTTTVEECGQKCLDHPECISFSVAERSCVLNNVDARTAKLSKSNTGTQHYQFATSRAEALAELAAEKERESELDKPYVPTPEELAQLAAHNAQFAFVYDPSAGTKNIHRFGRVDNAMVIVEPSTMLEFHDGATAEVCADKCLAHESCKAFGVGDEGCLLTSSTRANVPLMPEDGVSYYEFVE